MSDGLNYAHEKFSSAVYEMARSDAPLRERLRDAYMSFHPVGAFDLPERLHEAFTAIKTRLTAVPAMGTEGSLERTLLTVSDQECRRIAQLIVDLAVDIDAEVRDREWAARHRADRAVGTFLDGIHIGSLDELCTPLCEQERSG